jgi:hypothetical protein
MNHIHTKNRDFEAIAWGALFIWWGITELVNFLPQGAGAMGVGMILIGVNLARQQSGLPMRLFSLTVGVLALIWGGLELAGVMLNLPFELPIFAILLIALGFILLVPAFSRREE